MLSQSQIKLDQNCNYVILNKDHITGKIQKLLDIFGVCFELCHGYHDKKAASVSIGKYDLPNYMNLMPFCCERPLYNLMQIIKKNIELLALPF